MGLRVRREEGGGEVFDSTHTGSSSVTALRKMGLGIAEEEEGRGGRGEEKEE